MVRTSWNEADLEIERTWGHRAVRVAVAVSQTRVSGGKPAPLAADGGRTIRAWVAVALPLPRHHGEYQCPNSGGASNPADSLPQRRECHVKRDISGALIRAVGGVRNSV